MATGFRVCMRYLGADFLLSLVMRSNRLAIYLLTLTASLISSGQYSDHRVTDLDEGLMEAFMQCLSQNAGRVLSHPPDLVVSV
jgi:hypothetical protein